MLVKVVQISLNFHTRGEYATSLLDWTEMCHEAVSNSGSRSSDINRFIYPLIINLITSKEIIEKS